MIKHHCMSSSKSQFKQAFQSPRQDKVPQEKFVVLEILEITKACLALHWGNGLWTLSSLIL